MRYTVDFIGKISDGDIITHRTKHGTYIYTVNHVNEAELRPINLSVSYMEEELEEEEDEDTRKMHPKGHVVVY